MKRILLDLSFCMLVLIGGDSCSVPVSKSKEETKQVRNEVKKESKSNNEINSPVGDENCDTGAISHEEHEWGEQKITNLGTVELKANEYEVLFVERRINLIEGFKTRFFLIIKNKSESYSYEIQQNKPISFCIKDKNLISMMGNCQDGWENLGKELLCLDCLDDECIYLESNPLDN